MSEEERRRRLAEIERYLAEPHKILIDENGKTIDLHDYKDVDHNDEETNRYLRQMSELSKKYPALLDPKVKPFIDEKPSNKTRLDEILEQGNHEWIIDNDGYYVNPETGERFKPNNKASNISPEQPVKKGRATELDDIPDLGAQIWTDKKYNIDTAAEQYRKSNTITLSPELETILARLKNYVKRVGGMELGHAKDYDKNKANNTRINGKIIADAMNKEEKQHKWIYDTEGYTIDTGSNVRFRANNNQINQPVEPTNNNQKDAKKGRKVELDELLGYGSHKLIYDEDGYTIDTTTGERFKPNKSSSNSELDKMLNEYNNYRQEDVKKQGSSFTNH